MKRPFTLHSSLVICLMTCCFTGSIFCQSFDTLSTDLGRIYLYQTQTKQSIVLSDLIIGKYYNFQLTDNQGGFSCVPTLQESISSFRLIEDNEYIKSYRFLAISRTESITINMPCFDTRDYAFSLFCEDCLRLSTSRSSAAGVQVSQNDDENALIEEFLGGSCYEVLNIQSKGKPIQFGTYTNATLVEEVECGGLFNTRRDYSKSLGEKGIILSTGNVKDAEGPNQSRKTSTSVSGNTGDVDLTKLIGTGNVTDAVALEFDFIPTIETASFEYVFASEEYCEYVGSKFNDVFGFFVSGPGINGKFQNGAENIAYIPNQSEYVSINTVNNGDSCPYYVKNPRAFAGCGEGGGFSKFLDEIEYDGFTTLLTAEIDNLVPCDTYHIKLVIADVTDNIFDSAVFLKAGSFNAGGNAVAGVNIQDAEDPEAGLAYEGCQQSSFVFSRAENDTSEDLVINYRVSDESTAIPWFDYIPFGTSVTIPKGQMSVEVPVDVIKDDVAEGPESIKLDVDQACSCDTKGVEFTIIEPIPIHATMEDLTTCEGGSVTLSPRIEGGFGVVTYDWWHINGSPLSVKEVINSPTSFEVTVTDGCGTSDVAIANITIEDQFVSISGSELICNGNRQGGIEIALTGSGPWDLTYSRDGVEQAVIEKIIESPYILQDSVEGVYKVIRMEYGGCVGEGLPGEAELLVSSLDMDFASKDPSCFNTADGSVNTVVGGTGNLQYEWNTGSTEKNLNDIPAGDYVLSIVDEKSCIYKSDTITLNRPDEVFASFTVGGKVDCYTPLGATLEVSAEGGNSTAYGYAWQGLGTNSRLSGDAKQLDSIGGGDYTVQVTDGNGCIATKSITVVADTLAPEVKARGSNKLNCKVGETSLSGSGSAEGSMINYLWTTNNGNLVAGATTLTPTIDQPGTYELLVTNMDNGCQDLDQVAVTADYKKPETFVEVPDTLNCQQTQAKLSATIIAPTDDFTINWTTNNGSILSGEADASPLIASSGVYSFLVTDNGNGCEEEILIEVLEDVAKPIVNITSDLRLTCERQTLTLAADVNLADATYKFNWQPANPNSIISNRNTLNPVVDQPGAYTLTVQNQDNFCEETVDAMVVIDTIKPLADAGASFVFTCDLTTTSILANADEGSNYRYTWTAMDNGVIESGITNLRPSISRSGRYQIIVDNKNNGCSNMASVVVTDDPARPEAIIAAPENIDCKTPSIILDATASSGGNYLWKNEDGQAFFPSNSQRPIVTEPGKYTLEVTNPDGTCTGVTEVVVPLDTVAPVVNLGVPETLNCNKTTLRLDGTGSSKGADYSYAWAASFGGAINAGHNTLFPTIAGTGNYALLITNLLNGCTQEQNLIVEENIPRALQVEVIDPPCPNDEGQIEIATVDGGEGPYQYSIDGGRKYSDNSLFTRLDPKSYTVMVMDANGCTEESIVNIEAAKPIEITIDSEMAIDLGDSVTIETHTNLTETEIAYIQWTPSIGLSCDDCMDPIAQPLNSHQYKVDIVDNNGCDASATINFLVDANPQVYVPTAFSPNNDGFNDRLTIYAKNSVQLVKIFRVFNRWGSLVYEKENFFPNDENSGWDGRFDRKQLRPQVFIYFAEVEMINGEELVLKGDFALME